MWRQWVRKFRNAGRGVLWGIEDQNSFIVHIPVAVLVVLIAAILRCELWQWCVLMLCIGIVLVAELANSAIEELARGLCHEHNAQVGRALDIASGAVLVASLIAASIGAAIFLAQLWS